MEFGFTAYQNIVASKPRVSAIGHPGFPRAASATSEHAPCNKRRGGSDTGVRRVCRPFHLMDIRAEIKIPGYAHFDPPLGEEEARKLISDPQAVSAHKFLPLIRRTVIRHRFRKPNDSKNCKPRYICYAAKRDSVIFRAYRDKLFKSYEQTLEDSGLQDVVIAYRSVKSSLGRPMSTINFAVEAFEFIRSSESATVFCLDISGFFDTISHASIIGAWKR